MASYSSTEEAIPTIEWLLKSCLLHYSLTYTDEQGQVKNISNPNPFLGLQEDFTDVDGTDGQIMPSSGSDVTTTFESAGSTIVNGSELGRTYSQTYKEPAFPPEATMNSEENIDPTLAGIGPPPGPPPKKQKTCSGDPPPRPPTMFPHRLNAQQHLNSMMNVIDMNFQLWNISLYDSKREELRLHISDALAHGFTFFTHKAITKFLSVLLQTVYPERKLLYPFTKGTPPPADWPLDVPYKDAGHLSRDAKHIVIIWIYANPNYSDELIELAHQKCKASGDIHLPDGFLAAAWSIRRLAHE